LEWKAALLGAEQPCPTCQRPCVVRREERAIDFRGGEVTSAEPRCHCPACRRDFFPQRPGLRLTAHDYSPSVLGKIARSAAREPSVREAATAMAATNHGEIVRERARQKLAAFEAAARPIPVNAYETRGRAAVRISGLTERRSRPAA
jgi:hypothetical protein